MKEPNRYERTLRWYPTKWRERYGQGLVALLEDTYGERPLSLRVRISLARAGTIERARDVGILGDTTTSNERLRVGSHLVLCGWSLFVVAGTIFAKFTEHWSVATPVAQRTLPTIADTAVQSAGILSAAAVLVAALLVIPAVLRLVQAEGWTPIRRPLLRGAFAIGIVVAFTVGLIVWGHHLSPHQRNGNFVPFSVGASFTGLVVVAAIATVTSTVITVTRRLDLSRRVLRLLSSLALGLTVVMGVIAAGVGVWWANEATFAPHFLANGLTSSIVGTSNALPSGLIVAGVLMLLGLSSALAGSLRVLGAFKEA